MTPEQQKLFTEVRDGLEEIKSIVENSLSIRAVGGSVVTNKSIDLLKIMDKLETSLNGTSEE